MCQCVFKLSRKLTTPAKSFKTPTNFKEIFICQTRLLWQDNSFVYTVMFILHAARRDNCKILNLTSNALVNVKPQGRGAGHTKEI